VSASGTSCTGTERIALSSEFCVNSMVESMHLVRETELIIDVVQLTKLERIGVNLRSALETVLETVLERVLTYMQGGIT
jgi:hypothetical protein